MTYLYAIIAVVIVSLISFIGVITLGLKKKNLESLLLVLVAFSTGALIGDTFIHLIPEAVRESGGELTIATSISIFVGILIFFILEKFLRWRHCHDIDCEEHPHHLGTMNLVSDALHNLIDGALIGASFLVSIPLGLATFIAIVFHEIPHELGNYGVLVHSGYSRKRALVVNFFSGSAAVVGTIITLIIGARFTHLTEALIPITAGGFIYIAMSDLIPELHRENRLANSLLQLLFLICGILVMFLLLRIG